MLAGLLSGYGNQQNYFYLKYPFKGVQLKHFEVLLSSPYFMIFPKILLFSKDKFENIILILVRFSLPTYQL